MFESVGCGERQLPAHHSDLVQNRLVNGATFQLESDHHSSNFLVCHAHGIPFKLLFAKNPFKKAYQSSHTGLQLGCRLHVAGRHLAARAAPRRPKVNQQRDLVELQVLEKCSLGQVNRLASKQRLLALPAVGRAGKLVCTHAVGGLAMRADDVQGFAHTA